MKLVRNNLNHRNQIGTNLKPVCAWKSLEMGFSFVFVGCGVYGCCLSHVLGT